MTASVGRRKLRRQFLDAKPKSGDQQRRGWHWRTLDRNWTLFDLLVRTGDSDWIGGFGHDQLQHESELVGSSPPRRMQCQLPSAAGRNLHRDSTHNIGCCHWSYPFDHLRLYRGCTAQIKLVSDSLDPPA
jgi:hypothetical protein